MSDGETGLDLVAAPLNLAAVRGLGAAACWTLLSSFRAWLRAFRRPALFAFPRLAYSYRYRLSGCCPRSSYTALNVSLGSD
jgi:hypothetical protein